ncbi:MAG: hypothetical protein AAGB27_14560, partial [Pseudomonadota bacterium]
FEAQPPETALDLRVPNSVIEHRIRCITASWFLRQAVVSTPFVPSVPSAGAANSLWRWVA